MLKCKNTKKAIGWIGITGCLSMSFVVFITLLYAYFNEGFSTIYDTTTVILFELILVPIIILLGSYGLYTNMKEKI